MRFCRIITEKFKNVSVDCLSKAPVSCSSLNSYDGILIDENLAGESGMKFARRLHDFDWTIPKALITGHDLSCPTLSDSEIFVDETLSKNISQANQLQIGLASFIRQLSRIKFLKTQMSE